MRTEHVSLLHGGGAPRAIALRAPCGRDEIAVDGVDTRAAVALLARLLVGDAPLAADRLCASDRDRLLAALHRQCWGDRVEATLACEACAAPFDLSFDLSAVQAALAQDGSAWRPGGELRVANAAGESFAIPTATDEIEASGYGPREGPARLAAACGATGAASSDAAARALEAAAPIIDLDVAARCPDCGHEQAAHFDVQSFVLQRLINERGTLLAEVHVLATAYGWSLDEILSLARDTRQAFARLAGDGPPQAAARERAAR